MSLRYSCATVGRHARSLLPPSLPTLSLRALALHSAPTRRLSTHSGISALTPPWQFGDLTVFERKAFERWGPNYFEHLTPRQQELAKAMASKRADLAVIMEKEYGSKWYDLMQQATAIKDEQEAVELAKFQNEKQYLSADKETKAKLKKEYLDQEKATKLERLHAAMREVSGRRR